MSVSYKNNIRLLGKKYKLTDETIEFEGRTLHRIEALRDFGDVKAGDKGGFVQSEDNLSHQGDCWIFAHSKFFIDDNSAKVYDNAKVSQDAQVYGGSIVYNEAKIYGKALVWGHSFETKIYDNAKIYGRCSVSNSCIYGNAKLPNSSYVIRCLVSDNVQILGHSCLVNLHLSDNVIIKNTNIINEEHGKYYELNGDLKIGIEVNLVSPNSNYTQKY